MEQIVGFYRDIAEEHGISAWAVFAAGKQPVNNLVVSRFAEMFANGVVDGTMRLHSGKCRIEKYDIYKSEDKLEQFDHVLHFDTNQFRSRRYDKARIVQLGERISFRLRKDRQGGEYLVVSKVKKSDA